MGLCNVVMKVASQKLNIHQRLLLEVFKAVVGTLNPTNPLLQ